MYCATTHWCFLLCRNKWCPVWNKSAFKLSKHSQLATHLHLRHTHTYTHWYNTLLFAALLYTIHNDTIGIGAVWKKEEEEYSQMKRHCSLIPIWHNDNPLTKGVLVFEFRNKTHTLTSHCQTKKKKLIGFRCLP